MMWAHWKPSLPDREGCPRTGDRPHGRISDAPSGIQTSAGMGIAANYVVRNAQIAPSLGRSLAAGANGTVTANVVTPGTLQPDHVTQLDLRLSRAFSVRQLQFKPSLDMYNLLNASPAILVNNTYGTTGSSWLVPQVNLPGRLAQVNMRLTF